MAVEVVGCPLPIPLKSAFWASQEGREDRRLLLKENKPSETLKSATIFAASQRVTSGETTEKFDLVVIVK
jgi:hypothetical protein